ncbi:MAG: methyl-accepting chemotaxis protein [Planctomycetota bacterium]|nr:methyl-accepting chemotaxis protein [Planctomycetota bacterium]
MRSLRTLLLWAILPLLAIPLAVVIAVSSQHARQSALQNAGGVLGEVARSTLDTIYRNLFERIGDVQAFAANPAAVAMDAQALTPAINTYMKLYGIYDVMVVTDRSGTIVAVNTVDHQGAANPRTQVLLGRSLAGEAWFASVLQQDPKAISTDYEDLQVSSVVRDIAGGDGLVLRFSAPIVRDGAVVGVWTNYASWHRIVRDIMTTLADPARDGAGKLASFGFHGAELLLLDRRGAAIYDGAGRGEGVRDYAPRVTIEGASQAGQAVGAARAARQDRNGFTVEAHPLRSETYVVGWAWQASALGVGFERYDWGVLVRAPAAQALSSVTDLLQLQLIVGLIAFIAAAAVLVWVARSITRPLVAIEQAMAAVAQGDLTHTVAVGSRHEVGRLAASINATIERLRALIGQLDNAAQHLATQATQMRTTAQRLSAESRTVSEAVSATTSETQKLADTIGTVAAGSEEMTASISEISRHTTEAARLARDAVEHAQASNSAMQMLSDTSRQIGDIVHTIASIAEQTKLLSLNATIEAARAGEAGRGFAVVANEIRSLAGSTAESTDGIAQRVHAIQQSAQAAVQALEGIRQQIEHIDRAQQTIASAVEEQAATTKEMSQHLSSASASARAMSNQMQTAGNTVQTVSQVSHEAAQVAEQLTKASDELRQLVARFQR